MLLSCPQHTVHNLKGRSGWWSAPSLDWDGSEVEIDDYEEQFSEMFTLGPADPGVWGALQSFHAFPACTVGN